MHPIKLGYNAVPKQAERDVIKVFRSGQFSPGPKVKEFEEKWAKLHGAKHAIFVNSGTDALRLSLLAMKEKYGWKDQDEVAVTTQTFAATINIIIQSNLKPHFYDAGNPWSLAHQFDCGQNPKLIKAIIPVHLYGNPCDPYTFDLAAKYGWNVLEDSCETILNKIRGNMSCHSTYMAHHVTTGVGGIALTNSDDLNLLVRSYANHGRNFWYLPGYRVLETKTEDYLKIRFTFDRVGYSCRGTEFEAVLGLSQLKGLPAQIEKRRQVAFDLTEALYPYWQDLHVWEPGLYPEHTYMMFPILIKENSKLKKYDLCLHLEKAGIETRDMMPITSQPCYQHLLREQDYPASQRINKNGFYIACHPGLKAKHIDHIQKTFDRYCKKNK